MKNMYTSRVSEIFNVTLKSMGIELDFEDDEAESVKILDKTNIREHTLNGTTYLCSDYQFFIIERLAKLRAQILYENPIMTKEELDSAVDEAVKNVKFLNNYKEDLNELHLNVEAESKLVYEKIQDEKLKAESNEIANTLEKVTKEVNIEDVVIDD